MIYIDIDKMRADQASAVAEKPKIEIILPEKIARAAEDVEHMVQQMRDTMAADRINGTSLKEALTHDLNNQERDLRIERAKLSNKYNGMIANGAGQYELAAHYRTIEAISSEIREAYERRDYVERFGRLPENGSAQVAVDSANALALKDLKRSLVNRRNKLNTKIRKGDATKSPSVQDWKLQLDRLDTEYIAVNDRLKELRHE